jgi:hypothetical protein
MTLVFFAAKRLAQPSLTTAKSFHELVTEAATFTLLLWLLYLRLRLDARCRLSTTGRSCQVLAAHPLLAGKVGCASRELRRGAACLRRLKLRSPFPSSAKVLGVVVTSGALLLLLALGSGLRRRTGGTWLGEVGVKAFWRDWSLGCAVHVLSADVSSRSMSALIAPRRRPGHVPALAIVELHPVVLAILDLARALESLSKQVAEVVVIGGVLEAKVANIRQVLVELLRETITKVLDRSRLLLLSNLLILLLVSCSLEALPRQTAAEEVHEYVSKSLEVITARLLSTKMGVNAHISCGTGQRLPLPVWDVLLGLGVTVLLGHAEIHDVNNVRVFAVGTANKEVVRLDVTVDEVLLVNGLYTGQHLLGDHDNGLGGEAAVAVVKEILQGRSQQVDDKNVVETFLAKVIDIGDTSCEGIQGQ